MGKKKQVPGSIYQNRGRWYWAVKLPGEARRRARPLKPVGARLATKDRRVAELVARDIYTRATFTARPGEAECHTIAGLAANYLGWARGYYVDPDRRPTSEVDTIRHALTHLTHHCPTMAADDFGPLDLKAARQAMIDTKRSDGACRYSRVEINRRVGIWRRMFKWAASEGRVSPLVLHGLQAVEGLRRGRSGARETEPVKPIDEAHVRRVLPHASPTVAAMIELQLLTGMRSGELVILRPRDIDTSGRIWLYTPATHKTAWRGHPRVVALGPKAKRVLRPFLKRRLDAYCFSPCEAAEDRLARRRKRPGAGRRPDAARAPGERYDTRGYRRAVIYAIAAARRAATEPTDVVGFHPHQLRHTAATRVRRQFGLDAARALLGQRSLAVADDYAELDQALAVKAARKLG